MKNKNSYYLTGAIGLILFVLLTIIVKVNYTQAPIPWLDPTLQVWAYHLQSNHFLVTLSGLLATFLGDKIGAVLGLIIMAIIFFGFKERISAIWLALVAGISVGGNTVIKLLIGRDRPTTYRLADYAHESGKSFASGHSTFATILFLCLAFIIIQKVKNNGLKAVTFVIAALLIALTMFSRVLIGVHYPSDTMAGMLWGLSVVMLSYPLYITYNNKPVKKNKH